MTSHSSVLVTQTQSNESLEIRPGNSFVLYTFMSCTFVFRVRNAKSKTDPLMNHFVSCTFISCRVSCNFWIKIKIFKYLLKRFDFQDCAIAKTPMATATKLDSDPKGKSIDNTSYRGMMGHNSPSRGVPSSPGLLWEPGCLPQIGEEILGWNRKHRPKWWKS